MQEPYPAALRIRALDLCPPIRPLRGNKYTLDVIFSAENCNDIAIWKKFLILTMYYGSNTAMF